MQNASPSLGLDHIEILTSLSLPEWDLLIRQARSAGLLARMATLLEEAKLLDAVPPAPRRHLASALILSNAQSSVVHREVSYIREALHHLGIEIVLLKGTAYLLAGLPAAKGRFFSDVDILVPRESLAETEAALMLNGWATTHHNPYDQRYYRQWMHELPPMQHIKRRTIIDVHHTITPVTARLKPDARKLLSASEPIEGWQGFRVLSKTDMVLHSATHLFYNDELSQGLRDLSDLDLLLRHFGSLPDFWTQIGERAKELGLEQPLHYCLRNTVRVFATPIPDWLLREANVTSARLTGRLMDALWRHGLRSPHPSTTSLRTRFAHEALYVRAHWLRMPPWLLAYHLLVKSLRGKDH